MADKYGNFEQLSKNEVEGKDYKITVNDVGGDITCIAPHGGSIEPGTSEVTIEIAGDRYNLYLFEGIKSSGNMGLHITSTRFDEPNLLAISTKYRTNISIHGFEGTVYPRTYIGGLNSKLIEFIARELTNAGFVVDLPTEGIGGYSTRNFVNIGTDNTGVQLEISTAQRALFFEGGNLQAANRGNKTEVFYKYCSCLKTALAHYYERPIDCNTTYKMNFRNQLDNGTNPLINKMLSDIKHLQEQVQSLTNEINNLK